ncbi:MAG: ECF transporter S component [Clostridiales bacterium]|nr:ECF transporter S component [Clostridiales bacterium]
MKGVVFIMSVDAKTIKNSRELRSAMTRRIVVTAILTALAAILMYLEFPLAFLGIAPIAKYDFSEIPVLIGAFALGPVYAVIIEFLKNLIHLPVTGTFGVGELSNFIVGSIFCSVAGLIYNRFKTRKGALVSMLIATIVFTLLAIPINWFLNIPFYEKVMHTSLEDIIGFCSGTNKHVKDKMTVILFTFVPLNLIKGFVASFVTFWIYKPISNLIHKTREKTEVK